MTHQQATERQKEIRMEAAELERWYGMRILTYAEYQDKVQALNTEMRGIQQVMNSQFAGPPVRTHTPAPKREVSRFDRIGQAVFDFLYDYFTSGIFLFLYRAAVLGMLIWICLRLSS